jgi:hypothetical protein
MTPVEQKTKALDEQAAIKEPLCEPKSDVRVRKLERPRWVDSGHLVWPAIASLNDLWFPKTLSTAETRGFGLKREGFSNRGTRTEWPLSKGQNIGGESGG